MTIYASLRQKSIYIRQDHFKTNKTASPGFLIENHLTLVRKSTLLEDIRDLFSSIKTPENKIAEDWGKANEPDWKEPTAPAPYFTVSTSTRKFGNGTDRVETLVIHIECAEKDPLYFKLLLVKTYANKYAYGIFVSNGYHLTHGVEFFKQILRCQNSYLKDITALAIEGITENAMSQELDIAGKQITLMEQILTSANGVESVEETNRTKEMGK
eukprot:11949957-Ditylum_brightwellii.AAC.1